MNPTLLYNDECAVCRAIAGWVKASERTVPEASRLVVRPIGDDPAALRALDPGLDIWDAYETIHLLMPDGSTKCGGEAVAEVFRSLPNTRWFAPSFGWSIFGFRPFQTILNLGYTLLSDVRPLLGCESCGTPNVWVKAVRDPLERAMVAIGRARKSKRTAHFTPSAPKP
jgi:predicted DCC family thiol-disulfide oxidoreductase YuxK